MAHSIFPVTSTSSLNARAAGGGGGSGGDSSGGAGTAGVIYVFRNLVVS